MIYMALLIAQATLLFFCSTITLSYQSQCEPQNARVTRLRWLQSIRDDLGHNGSYSVGHTRRHILGHPVHTEHRAPEQTTCMRSMADCGVAQGCSACSPIVSEAEDRSYGGSSPNHLEVSTHSLCEWRYHINTNWNRYPQNMTEAVQTDGHACSNKRGHCEPVHYHTWVMFCVDHGLHGCCGYEMRLQTLNIGYICAHPVNPDTVNSRMRRQVVRNIGLLAFLASENGS